MMNKNNLLSELYTKKRRFSLTNKNKLTYRIKSKYKTMNSAYRDNIDTQNQSYKQPIHKLFNFNSISQLKDGIQSYNEFLNSKIPNLITILSTTTSITLVAMKGNDNVIGIVALIYCIIMLTLIITYYLKTNYVERIKYFLELSLDELISIQSNNTQSNSLDNVKSNLYDIEKILNDTQLNLSSYIEKSNQLNTEKIEFIANIDRKIVSTNKRRK